MITIRLASAAFAAAVSHGLWNLSRPASVNPATDTQYFAPWEVQGDGTALLIVDPAWTLPIHAGVVAQITDATDAQGSRAALATLLGPLLTNATTGLPAVRALIAKGGSLTIGDILPLLNPALAAPYVAPVRATP
jgi:hypothetical protein